MGGNEQVERQVPPRSKVMLEAALELMDLGIGSLRVELLVQDGRIDVCYVTEKIPGKGLGRFDANRLEPEEQRGEIE